VGTHNVSFGLNGDDLLFPGKMCTNNNDVITIIKYIIKTKHT
jgi:hypothetical protein